MKIDNLKIFTGRTHPALAEAICKQLSLPLGNALVQSFPDTESFVKIIDHIRGDDVFIIQPTCRPSNDSLMELLIMIDAAKRASAKRITAVLPFYGYARQDRKDQPRVPITAKLVANLITAAGADRVLTLDLHATQIQGFFDIPCDHLYASPVIYDYLKDQPVDNLTIFSPDVGGLKRAQAYATLCNCQLGFIAKRRISAEVVEATSLVGEVEGRDILIVDDMTETAGTLTAAAKLLKDHGAKSVKAAVTHGILTDTAYDRLNEKWLDELIVTDSTPPDPRYADYPITVLPIANLLAEAGGDNIFVLYTIIVWASVAISAFIDNIPYVATMIPVIAGIAAEMGIDSTALYFGLLSGATLGGNCTPIGASANIAGIGILRKEGYDVKNSDFFKIGIPFTMAAIIPAYILIWLLFGA